MAPATHRCGGPAAVWASGPASADPRPRSRRAPLRLGRAHRLSRGPAAIARSRRFHVFRDDALGAPDATELAGRLAAGEVSPVELVEAAMDRVEQAQPSINAVVTCTFERALDAARALPPRTAPSVAAPFVGVPTFVKDNTDVAGAPALRRLALHPGPAGEAVRRHRRAPGRRRARQPGQELPVGVRPDPDV